MKETLGIWLLTTTMLLTSTTHYAITLSWPIRGYIRWLTFINHEYGWFTWLHSPTFTEDLLSQFNADTGRYDTVGSSASVTIVAVQAYIPIINVSRVTCLSSTMIWILLHYQYVAGDSIALWRAWVIWNRDRRLLALSIILISAMTGMSSFNLFF